jgi:hypothetical protein
VKTGYSRRLRARRAHGTGSVSPIEEAGGSFADAKAVLEASTAGDWVLIHDGDAVGTFDTFDDAAARAVEEYGVGSYLIRTGGVVTVTLPASVVFGRTG